MTGLIRNNFYSMESNIKLSFLLSVVIAAVPCLTGSQKMLSTMVAVQILLFVVNTGSSLQADEAAKWNKFEITLPVERRTIIGAKYITMAVLVFLGLIMGGLTTLLTGMTGMDIKPAYVIWGFGFGLSLSLTSVAFMYPAMLKLGTEKSEMIICISAFCAVGIINIIGVVLSPIIGSWNYQHPVKGVALTIISFGLYLLSYAVALGIHRRKEF